MKQRLAQITSHRKEKLAAIKKLGIDPYPSRFDKKNTIHNCRNKVNKKVQTAGRIKALRGHGKLIFVDLIDETGKIQILLRAENLSQVEQELALLLDIGDFIGVSGIVTKTKTGEISILAKKLSLLSKSVLPLPGRWHGLKDTEERFRKRYIDLLLNPQVRQVFDTRTKLIKSLRAFLDENGFFEVETPILQPTYGGASAQPFITHHRALSSNFYLRISDELYLKRLVVGGFEKVFEIGI